MNTNALLNEQQDTDKVQSSHFDKPVLFVVDSFFPAMGGAERQALVLAKALRGRGVTVEFVAPHLEPICR